MVFIFLLPLVVSPFLILIHFAFAILRKEQFLHIGFFRTAEFFTVIVFPLLFINTYDSGHENNCCDQDVFFSVQHRFTIYLLMFFSGASYFYSSLRAGVAPPLVEIIINCFLVIGIALNILISLHHNEFIFFLAVNLPMILLLILMLLKNQRMAVGYLQNTERIYTNRVGKIAWKFLRLNVFIQIPLLAFLCLPLLFIITSILLLFGQRPDSFIRAFTDTYHHGLSQLTSECDNVDCDQGHYLCTVAAKGHKKFVRPIRLGERRGGKIICNRQLLVSNAFEELLQEHMPIVHKRIKKTYNRVGNVVHRYYGIFNNKYVADMVYVLMKPLEWFFIMVLYTFDTKPENRIARQYLSKADRAQLKTITG